MTTTPTSDTIIEKHSMVSIEGLQSEAGKRFNGGLGIIIGVPREENGLRYPVRVFALKDDDDDTKFAILRVTEDKKLKAMNVKPVQSEVALDCVKETVDYQSIQAQKQNDAKTIMFWLATSYHIRPEAYHYGISYANALTTVEGKHKQASDLCYEILQKHDITQDPRYPSMCKDVVLSFCDAKEHLEFALKYALLIPKDSTENIGFRKGALLEFVNTCKKMQTKAKCVGVDNVAQWNLTAAIALQELDPENRYYNECVGGAYCLTGDNWQGVQWYRKALALGADSAKPTLVIAQLQCPDMPLENYHILNVDVDNNKLLCIHKKDLNSITVDPATGDVINSGKGDLDMITYEAPDDPNDPEAFSELLEKLGSAN